MLRSRIGELILSLVMPRERSAAVVGDLLEASRGILRFWSVVVATVITTIVQEMVSSRQAIAMTAYAVLLCLTYSTLFDALLTLSRLVRLGLIPSFPFLLLMPIFVGRSVARLSDGKELAAWTAIAIFACTNWIAWKSVPESSLLDYRFFALALPSPIHLPGMLIGVLSPRIRKLL